MNDAFALALGQMQSAAHRAWATKRALELSFTRGLYGGLYGGSDLSPRGIDFEGRAFVTNVAVAASSPRVSVNLEPHDGTKGTDDKVSRPIVDSNRASPMKSVPRRWATRWNELKTMRKLVLSQLEKQNHFYVPEKSGVVKIMLMDRHGGATESGRWLSRRLQLDPVNKDLKLLHPKTSSLLGSFLLCSIVGVAFKVVNDFFVLKLDTNAFISVRCTTQAEAQEWVELLQRYAGSTINHRPRDKSKSHALGDSVTCSACANKCDTSITSGESPLMGTTFCNSECQTFFEKTLQDGFEISFINVNGVNIRRFVPFASKSALDPTAELVVGSSRRASLHIEVLKDISSRHTSGKTTSKPSHAGVAIDGEVYDKDGASEGRRVPILVSTRTFIDKKLEESPRITFGAITIYAHARLPAGSSGVPSNGVPLGIGWECVGRRKTTVDEFEELKIKARMQEYTFCGDSSDDDGGWRFHRDGRLEPHERLSLLALHGWDDKEHLEAIMKQMKQINNDRMSTVRSRTGKMVLRGEDPDQVAVWEAAVLAGKPDPLQGTSLTKPAATAEVKVQEVSSRRYSMVATPMAGSMAHRQRAMTTGALPPPKAPQTDRDGKHREIDAAKMKFLLGAKAKTLKKSKKHGIPRGRRARSKTLKAKSTK